MALGGQTVSRHLVFVLEDGTVVVQRGANLVEVLGTREERVFESFDHHHDVTNDELRQLQEKKLILHFDDGMVWLPPSESLKTDVGRAKYYFLDTKLSPPYLKIVQSLLEATDLRQNYAAAVQKGAVTIMTMSEEPFSNLNDAEAAITLIQQALGQQLVNMSIESVTVDSTTAGDTQPKRPSWQKYLITSQAITALADAVVLIIEDDETQAAYLREALRDLELSIREASTGETALEIVLDEEPDLILVDLTLPDIHGYEVVARIKKDAFTSQTPIIALSSYASETDVTFALYVAKVDDYLIKPVDARQLRQRVINILNKS